MIDLSAYHLHLVLCPVDMRRGFHSLNTLADIALGIDVQQGRDCVKRNAQNLYYWDKS